MTKYLKIQNNGVLDIRLVALMGGTTKANDIYKIGQFGTGLKYTLAYLLRNNVKFKIFAGLTEVKIDIQTEKIKDEDFHIICIDGHRTSITTKMGADWQAWMIVRELYSNALDEGGASYEVAESFNPSENTTSFYIELTTDFLKVYNDWHKYFIVGNIPMYEDKTYALHPTAGNLKIYKQGILIHEENRKAMFNYDLKKADINELREYKGTLSSDISMFFFDIKDKKVIQYILEHITETDQNDESVYYEAKLDLYWWGNYYTMNKAWEEVIGNAKVISKESKKNLIAKNINIDLDHTIEVSENLYKALTQRFEGIGAVRMADKVNEFYEIFDTDLSLKLKSAIATLEAAGYFIHPELTFLFGEFGSKDILAKISMDKKEILISQKMKDKSMFEFCAILVEENEHFQTGYSDLTREFQTHFIHLYTKKMFDNSKIPM